MLDDFGLLRLGPAHPFTLSHGEQRRLSVASMLVLGQRLLLLDEPTFGQDQRNATMLLDKLEALAAAGRAIVVVSHDMRLVAERAAAGAGAGGRRAGVRRPAGAAVRRRRRCSGARTLSRRRSGS